MMLVVAPSVEVPRRVDLAWVVSFPGARRFLMVVEAVLSLVVLSSVAGLLASGPAGLPLVLALPQAWERSGSRPTFALARRAILPVPACQRVPALALEGQQAAVPVVARKTAAPCPVVVAVPPLPVQVVVPPCLAAGVVACPFQVVGVVPLPRVKAVVQPFRLVVEDRPCRLEGAVSCPDFQPVAEVPQPTVLVSVVILLSPFFPVILLPFFACRPLLLQRSLPLRLFSILACISGIDTSLHK